MSEEQSNGAPASPASPEEHRDERPVALSDDAKKAARERVHAARVKRVRTLVDGRLERLDGSRLTLLEHVIAAEDDAAALARLEPALDALRARASADAVADARRLLRPAGAVLRGLPERWANPKPATSTGLRRLDGLLNGGLRGGDMIALAGQAKGGKSALAGQIAFDFAAAGVSVEGAPAAVPRIVVYVSVEMPEDEPTCRWITREAFKRTIENRWPWLSYGAVLYGAAYRGEVSREPDVNRTLHRLLLDSMSAVERVVGPPEAPRLFIQRAPTGTTPQDIRALVRAAREPYPGAAVLLVVDPLQRLFAGPSRMLTGRVLDQTNANETERVARVAEQLKTIADEDDVAIIFTSDTTKEAVRTSGGSSTGLRGSYQLNHWATLVLGLQAGEDPGALAQRLSEAGLVDQAEDFANRLRHEAGPAWWEHASAVDELGRYYAVLECSGARNARARTVLLGFVPGAMCFVEGDDQEGTAAGGRTPTAPAPKARKKRASYGRGRPDVGQNDD